MERLTAALAERYRIERELGAGGMATVYLAEDLKHQRKVAVKVLRADLAASLGPERFLREVTIAASLQHPHVLPLYDSGQADGFLYYVMPFVEGTSLRQKLVREGELPIAEAVRILRDIADAMAYAHQHAVVHRDIKPENVMLSGRHALVTDFGVAKAVSEATGRQTLTTAGVALGTPTYMAPEQATADPHTDHRADIYAFGVVAYELLSGQPPFAGPSPQAVLAAHVTTAAEPVTKYRASIPPTLAALVMRCLEKKPADRWQSAEELIPQLEAVLTPSGGMTPTTTQPIPAAPVPAVSRRSNAWLFVGGAVVLAGAVGSALYLSRGGGTDTPGGVVAVLPLTSRSADSTDVLLGEGIADAVGAHLSRLPTLQVLSATAVRTMQTRVQDPLEAARALNAQWVVAGILRRGEGVVTASVEVIRASSGIKRWSASFHQPAASLVSLDKEIAESVAVVLAGARGSARTVIGSRVGTADPEAYRLFLLGEASFARRTEASMNEAVRYYGMAIARDSAFVPAWASLGRVRSAQFTWRDWRTDVPRDSLPRQAHRAIDRALRLDSLNLVAWAADGMLAAYGGDLVRAKRSLEYAIRIDSLDAYSWFILGAALYGSSGLNQQEIAEPALRRAISLEPSLQNAWRHLANVVQRTGRLAEAEQLLDTALTLGDWATAFEDRAEVRFYRGNGSGALEDLEKAERLSGQRDAYNDARYRIATGDRSPARTWLDQHPLTRLANPPSAEDSPVISQAARMYASLGMGREAIEALGRLDPGIFAWATLHDYSFAAIRSDPQFQRLLDRSRPAFLSSQ